MSEDMGVPAWWKCTSSTDRRFTAGVAYEVQRYDPAGNAVIVTDIPRTLVTLPVERAEFAPHDPWAAYRNGCAQ